LSTINYKGFARANTMQIIVSWPWPVLFLAMLTSILAASAVFGIGYFLAEPTMTAWDGFNLAVQTITTVGYGVLSPSTMAGNILVVLNSFAGLGVLTFTSGTFFFKMSLPNEAVAWANRAIIAPNRDNNGHSMAFQLINMGTEEMFDSRVRAFAVQVSSLSTRLRPHA
jgi:hypothetical protein